MMIISMILIMVILMTLILSFYLWQICIKYKGPKVGDPKDADQSSDQRLRYARRQQ